MISRTYFKDQQNASPGVISFWAVLPTSTNGTIDTADSQYKVSKGLTVAKTATETGRYTFTLPGSVVSVLAVQASVEGAADAAYTAAKGQLPLLRGVSESTGVLYVQLTAPSTQADAEVEDGAIIRVRIDVQTSKAQG